MQKSESGSPSPYTAHVSKKKQTHAPRIVNDRAERQHSRYSALKSQFNKCARNLVGRTAMLVLPGIGARHATEQFRPVHWERQWRVRPIYVLLSVGWDGQRYSLKLHSGISLYDAAAQKLRYMNGNGKKESLFDFLRPPAAGASAPILDGSVNYVLFTAANNLLQELVNTADQDVGELTLPRLVCLIEGKHLPLDPQKLDRLAAKMPAATRELYKQRKAEEAEIVSLGTRFCDAEVMTDAAIKKAFREKRAYEDYSDLLGAETANPARKILMARNPASAVLTKNGLAPGWDEAAHQALDCDAEAYSARLAEHQGLYEKLLAEMRGMLPLPELVSDSDLLDALAEPSKPIRLSRTLADLCEKEPGAVIRAMRNTMPFGSALREHVRDDELINAARNPYSPMIIGAYSKIQVVKTEDFSSLPAYATGSFWSTPQQAVSQLPVWPEGDMPGSEEGVAQEGAADCEQLQS